jgi:hypothetical protein
MTGNAVLIEGRGPGPILASEIDLLLTAQLAVAWAGEKGEDKRLGWWDTDLVSEFGGEDLFQQLMPHTWEWAVLQAAREAARRHDAELRQQDHDPDRILSLFNWGFVVDERLDERLADLKQSTQSPLVALPGLRDVIFENWDAKRFGEWIQCYGKEDCVPAPIGRRLKGEPPESRELIARRLVAALWPLVKEYPLPHFRRAS